jgi:hypothetical protein
LENQSNIDKQTAYKSEYDKLVAVFNDVEESKRKLVDGLIKEAAFLYSENYVLREMLKVTGMVKCHPQYPEMQKTIPAAAQYLKNLNSYSVVIKTLNGVLTKGIIDPGEDMSEFE